MSWNKNRDRLHEAAFSSVKAISKNKELTSSTGLSQRPPVDKNIIIPLNNNSSRGIIREIFSKFYIYFLNIIFLKNIKYYNGANVYKKNVLKKIIKMKLSNSHFFLAQVLIIALSFKNQ